MRAVHDFHLSKKEYGNTGAFPFDNFSAKFREETYCIAPSHPCWGWTGKNQLQCFSWFGSHIKHDTNIQYQKQASL